jgi:hypothetical protein
MRVDMAGQYGILALLAYNDAKLWQMDKLVHVDTLYVRTTQRMNSFQYEMLN